jgi:hypothetical protein
MCVEVGFNHLVKWGLGSIGQQTPKITTKGNEVRLQLSHGVLSQAPCAEADSLAEWTDPALVLAALNEVAFVLSLHAE